MFDSNEVPSLTEYDMSELRDLVSQMFYQLLSTGEQVIKIVEKYGLIISINQEEGDYQGCVFDFLRCEIHEESIELHNPPLFVGQRNIKEMEDFQSYLDEESLEDLASIRIQAVLYASGLIRGINLQES